MIFFIFYFFLKGERRNVSAEENATVFHRTNSVATEKSKHISLQTSVHGLGESRSNIAVVVANVQQAIDHVTLRVSLSEVAVATTMFSKGRDDE